MARTVEEREKWCIFNAVKIFFYNYKATGIPHERFAE